MLLVCLHSPNDRSSSLDLQVQALLDRLKPEYTHPCFDQAQYARSDNGNKHKAFTTFNNKICTYKGFCWNSLCHSTEILFR